MEFSSAIMRRRRRLTVLEGPDRDEPVEETGWEGGCCQAGSVATARRTAEATVRGSRGAVARGSEGAATRSSEGAAAGGSDGATTRGPQQTGPKLNSQQWRPMK